MAEFRTERQGFRCTVKETADGRAYLMFEPSGDGEISALASVRISLDLSEDATIADASRLAREINRLSVGLAATIEEGEDMTRAH